MKNLIRLIGATVGIIGCTAYLSSLFLSLVNYNGSSLTGLDLLTNIELNLHLYSHWPNLFLAAYSIGIVLSIAVFIYNFSYFLEENIRIMIQSKLKLYIGKVKIEEDWQNILLDGIVLILTVMPLLNLTSIQYYGVKSSSLGLGLQYEFIGGIFVVFAGILLKVGKSSNINSN